MTHEATRQFIGFGDGVRPVGPAIRSRRFVVGATLAHYITPSVAFSRIAIVGVSYDLLTGAAGRAAVQVRKAPMEVGAGNNYFPFQENMDDAGVTAGFDFDDFLFARRDAAAEAGSTPIWPPNNSMLVSRPTDGVVPLVRIVDEAAGFAAFTVAFSGAPSDGDTITIDTAGWNHTVTFKDALDAAPTDDQVLIGGSAISCANNLRKLIMAAGVDGENYKAGSTNTWRRGTSNGYWCVWDAANATVTIYTYEVGTGPNARANTKSGANITISTNPAGGAGGALSSDTTDYIAVTIDYIELREFERSI